MIKKEDLNTNNAKSKNLYNLISRLENKSALDYKYWEIKILHQINYSSGEGFENNFLNLFILSKNNEKKNKSLKLYYLRNIPRFSDTIGDIILRK
tara:strand:+ start:1426 stop:1710 length:285 start_codon:yes stop_codon:yes gene_type:complete